jgi:hypothetical protein
VQVELNKASSLGESGAGSRIRTRDPLITNQVLYQLSYTGQGGAEALRVVGSLFPILPVGASGNFADARSKVFFLSGVENFSAISPSDRANLGGSHSGGLIQWSG